MFAILAADVFVMQRLVGFIFDERKLELDRMMTAANKACRRLALTDCELELKKILDE